VLIFTILIVGILGACVLGGAPTEGAIAIAIAIAIGVATTTSAVWNNKRGTQ
jgi:hypothetical protein